MTIPAKRLQPAQVVGVLTYEPVQRADMIGLVPIASAGPADPVVAVQDGLAGPRPPPAVQGGVTAAHAAPATKNRGGFRAGRFLILANAPQLSIAPAATSSRLRPCRRFASRTDP